MAKTSFCDSTLEDQEREKQSNTRQPNICSEPKQKQHKLLLYGWKQKIKRQHVLQMPEKENESISTISLPLIRPDSSCLAKQMYRKNEST